MKVKAHAKINIALNVVGKRSDGYHELEMIMVPLTLHDVITIELAPYDCFTCSEEGLAMDEDNTVVKAVTILRNTLNIHQHFKIHVEKHIPAQAGLAGGSADAAGVLRGIRDLLQLDISLDALSMLGKQVGADVPFCVKQCCAIVKGIGEIIEPFAMPANFDILLVKPQTGVPTGKAFGMLDFNACAHPDCEAVKKALQDNDLVLVQAMSGNSLEYSAFQLVPEIQDIKKDLLKRGLEVVLMSGSGSTIFALSQNKEKLSQAANDMHKQGHFVTLTNILS